MSASRRLVAIADPFPDEAELYQLAFGAAGFALHALPTDDPAKAASAALNARPHLVVTRILPGRFGIGLVGALRRQEETAHVPILVLTTYVDPRLHEEARQAGASDVLLLPVDPEELVKLARRLILDNDRESEAC